ncbi:hypothetical protein RRG08_032653 [Elysia crispata]|uniref:Uncharacterized protein n=1 Tax=Elysia crispata TaxID=231223 RepID=A0AAE1CQA6_9GAST|nr:hypothetical protein RRG08_032653 [Elysia crispata]
MRIEIKQTGDNDTQKHPIIYINSRKPKTWSLSHQKASQARSSSQDSGLLGDQASWSRHRLFGNQAPRSRHRLFGDQASRSRHKLLGNRLLDHVTGCSGIKLLDQDISRYASR